jgi:Flp pilus assembly protein TadD
MRGAGALLLAAALLAGCAETADRRLAADSPYAPAAEIGAAPEVDPMTVGHRLMAAGEHELALKSFYRAAADDGMTTEITSAIGSAQLGLGRLHQAEALLRDAVAAAPEDPRAWNNLGVVLMEKGEYAEASEVFRRAFAFDAGESSLIRENLRLALEKIENPAYGGENKGQFALVQDDASVYRLATRP